MFLCDTALTEGDFFINILIVLQTVCPYKGEIAPDLG